MSAHTTCDETAIKKISREVKKGASVKRAAPKAGYSWNTVRQWLKRARRAARDEAGELVDPRDAPFVRFRAAMERAKASWAADAEQKIASAKDWKAHAYLLERRYGREYRLPPLTKVELFPAGDDDDGGIGPQLPGSDGDEVRTILMYPVPVPVETRKLALPAQVVDTNGEDA